MKPRTSTAKTALLLLLAAVTAATTAACGSAPEPSADAAVKPHLTAARTASGSSGVQTAAASKAAKAATAPTAAQESKQTAPAPTAAAGAARGDSSETRPDTDPVRFLTDEDKEASACETICDEPFDSGDAETDAAPTTEAAETDDPSPAATASDSADEPDKTEDGLSVLEGGMWLVYGYGHPDFTTYAFHGDTVTITNYSTRLGDPWTYRPFGEPYEVSYTVTDGSLALGGVTLTLTDDDNRLRVTREDPYNYLCDSKRYYEDHAYRHSELPTVEELRAESEENWAISSYRTME